jgi:hypothetical protein
VPLGDQAGFDSSATLVVRWVWASARSRFAGWRATTAAWTGSSSSPGPSRGATHCSCVGRGQPNGSAAALGCELTAGRTIVTDTDGRTTWPASTRPRTGLPVWSQDNDLRRRPEVLPTGHLLDALRDARPCRIAALSLHSRRLSLRHRPPRQRAAVLAAPGRATADTPSPARERSPGGSTRGVTPLATSGAATTTRVPIRCANPGELAMKAGNHRAIVPPENPLVAGHIRADRGPYVLLAMQKASLQPCRITAPEDAGGRKRTARLPGGRPLKTAVAHRRGGLHRVAARVAPTLLTR